MVLGAGCPWVVTARRLRELRLWDQTVDTQQGVRPGIYTSPTTPDPHRATLAWGAAA